MTKTIEIPVEKFVFNRPGKPTDGGMFYAHTECAKDKGSIEYAKKALECDVEHESSAMLPKAGEICGLCQGQITPECSVENVQNYAFDNYCPFCRDEDAEVELIETHYVEDNYYADRSCSTCGSRWADCYRFDGVLPLDSDCEGTYRRDQIILSRENANQIINLLEELKTDCSDDANEACTDEYAAGCDAVKDACARLIELLK